ncbi:sulfite exporter TauE/SafE family protein [Lentzea sp. HUAS TT2]|uniref:sulfite exporter TauE/SafE family protein n=1 Tax=Lentzea sp. HUAS TT2 TaxID=3447454 RepID=UPI003F71F210
MIAIPETFRDSKICLSKDGYVAWHQYAFGFTAGLLISLVTAPVGVSGAVFLLPVQLSVLAVPSPAVTPTNLMFNIVATPGALFRYRRHGSLGGPLTRQLVAGTLPGVVAGAVIRVFAVPGAREFRLIVAGVLLPLGVWLCWRTARPQHDGRRREPSPKFVVTLGVVAGAVGGIYGIGGGSMLGPVLVGWGLPVTVVAPAALASTFLTSIVGAATYAVLSLTTSGDISPQWLLGLTCGLGGLLGGYLGAHLQPRLPEVLLRRVLGGLAISLALLYLVQAFR